MRWHRGDVDPVPFSGYCVYRAANAEYVERLVRSAPSGSAVYLHALDHVPASLADVTVSQGPGMRMPLLNGLMAANPPAEGQPVILFDDDVTFLNDAVATFVGLSSRAQLDVAQPAHISASQHSFRVVRVDPLATVRRSRLVESGPVVYLAPHVWQRLCPFPADLGMGWGVDVWWSALQEPALALGVVDATPVMHHGRVAVAYDGSHESEILGRYLASAGLDTVHQLDSNLGLTWRPWQRAAKWVR